jgi:putative FmdB family regulatory protein
VPTYEYLCDSCGNRYEKQESFSAKPKQRCPKCAKTANRVIFAPPIVFKGNGFYKTDNRGSGSSDTSGSSSSEDSSTPSVPDAATSHGHSHGPGGHNHDTPAPSTTDAAAAG